MHLVKIVILICVFKKLYFRFDFEGWLQPFSIKDVPLNDKTRILYHHGNEEYRPGYSLEELIHLCR